MTGRPQLRVESVHPCLPRLLAWAEEDPDGRMWPDVMLGFRAGWDAREAVQAQDEEP